MGNHGSPNPSSRGNPLSATSLERHCQPADSNILSGNILDCNLPEDTNDAMAKVEIRVKAFRCERCEHKWQPRSSDTPRVCPKCKSPYWDRRPERKLKCNDNSKAARREVVNRLNDLSAKEWIPETVSVWTQRGLGKGHEHAQIERQHPAPFSFQDVARLIKFFSKREELVLDPFVGVGSTLKAASLEGRRGIGIELNERYVSLAKQRIKTEVKGVVNACQDQRIILGDARDELPKIKEVVKMVVTSPPYWNILHKQDHKAKQERLSHGLDTHYSDNAADLGNIRDYDLFIEELADTLGLSRNCLADGGHMCLVVGDFRHKAQYYMYHADIARAMEQRGFLLKGITILYQRHKRVFPYGFPYSYVPNLHHQYIVILQKI